VVVLSPGALEDESPEAELPESASEATVVSDFGFVVSDFGTDDEVVVGSTVIDEGEVVEVVGATVDVVVVVSGATVVVVVVVGGAFDVTIVLEPVTMFPEIPPV